MEATVVVDVTVDTVVDVVGGAQHQPLSSQLIPNRSLQLPR